MASVTLSEFRTRARRRADMENSTFIADAELNRYINDSISELYDLLILTRGENYYVTSSTVTTSGGTADYALPADFYKLLGVDWVQSSTQSVDLLEFRWQERNQMSNPVVPNGFGSTRYQLRGSNLTLMPIPSGVNNLKLWYIPRFAELSTDGSTFDGINGWEEYIVIDAAIKMRVKEESPADELMFAKQQMRDRIIQASSARDSAQPARVIDVNARPTGWWF